MGYLTDKLNQVNDEISKKENEIKNLETAHDKLLEFRGKVQNSNEDFSYVNEKEAWILDDLDPIISNCDSAKKYKEGMQVSLNGIGIKVVGAAFWGLDKIIGVKLLDYKAKVELAELDLGALRLRKKDLELKIAAGEAISDAIL